MSTSVPGSWLEALARQLALVVHAGQSRKGSGEPYVGHVYRVENRVAALGWRARTIALLHDTVEDTRVDDLTLGDIGFPKDIVQDVLALSRTDPDEAYAEFTARTIRDGSNDALQVKLADLHDNLTDPAWTRPGLPERYTRADAEIRAELIRRGVTPLVFTLQ